jgi:competence protein ComEA
MLGRRKISRAESAAVAQRRLDALESSFSGRRVGPAHIDDLDDLDEFDEFDEFDDLGIEPRGGGEIRKQRSVATPRSRGRHTASSLIPARRLALTAQQVTLLALAVAAVVALAAWWVIRAVPRAEPVQLAQQRIVPSPPTEPSLPSALEQTGAQTAPTTGGGPSAGTLVVVDVAGKVRKPGIVELPAGSRVVDALDAAGGAKHGVDTSTLNLARPLVDGEQIVVGVDTPAMPPPGAASGGSTSTAITPVNLNTATIEQLDTLPGIGPVTAQAILDWRSENGAFTSVDELLEVSGIGDATLADIEAYVYV